MSATSGMRICLLISPSFSAASLTGTAHRTMSQPAASSDQISSKVAWTSRVSVLVMDCTVIGAPPPTARLPSLICRVFRRVIIAPSLSENSKRVDPDEVIVNREDHQEQQKNEPELLRGFALLERHRPAENAFDDEEQQVPAV